MPHRDVPALMTALRQRDEIAAHALAFAILTAARRSEVISARWDEIDLDAKIWTVPGSRMKSGREHRVPLSDAAIDLLRKMQEDQDEQHDRAGICFPFFRETQQADSGNRHGVDASASGPRRHFPSWLSFQLS